LRSTASRRLIHIPIIHTQADMGMLGDAFKRALVDQLGEQWWEHNLSVVESAWMAIEKSAGGA
jgi:hypothetical protein